MRAHVLEDPALMKLAGRFVWLSLDREKTHNAAFLARYASSNTPTYWIIDPASGEPVLKWIGIATVEQFQRLLEDGDRAIHAGATEPAAQALARGDRLAAEGKNREAAEQYREALRVAVPGWSRRDRAVESLTFALDEAGDKAGCAQAALDELPKMDRGPSFANAAGNGLACALAAGAHIDELSPLVIEAIDVPNVGSDRVSELYELEVAVAKKKGDAKAAREWAEKWIHFLEESARAATTPEARTAYDGHLLSAAMDLGQPERVVPALERNEKDLPNDFNPPARLCVAYLAMNRLADAEAACHRALGRGMDGPRRLRVLGTLADVQEKKGDRAAARATLEDAIRFAESLPAPQRSDAAVRRLRERLQALH
jgi:tetratricopeptide (TPR) repeat protein